MHVAILNKHLDRRQRQAPAERNAVEWAVAEVPNQIQDQGLALYRFKLRARWSFRKDERCEPMQGIALLTFESHDVAGLSILSVR